MTNKNDLKVERDGFQTSCWQRDGSSKSTTRKVNSYFFSLTKYKFFHLQHISFLSKVTYRCTLTQKKYVANVRKKEIFVHNISCFSNIQWTIFSGKFNCFLLSKEGHMFKSAKHATDYMVANSQYTPEDIGNILKIYQQVISLVHI